ncbi:MAG: helix-turn-helix domain-containing protein [Planctomycetes bacterium]|nr:helix-turn-helix domain-containing protein [Planctomycetota bacterium]
MPWISKKVEINLEQRKMLIEIIDSVDKSKQEKQRAQIVLLLAEGKKNKEIADMLQVHENTVVKWRGRWASDQDRNDLIDSLELNGRPRSVLTSDKMDEVRIVALSEPPDGRIRWTVRSLARELHLPIATLQRALGELGIDLLKKDGSLVEEELQGNESSAILRIPEQLYKESDSILPQ